MFQEFCQEDAQPIADACNSDKSSEIEEKDALKILSYYYGAYDIRGGITLT